MTRLIFGNNPITFQLLDAMNGSGAEHERWLREQVPRLNRMLQALTARDRDQLLRLAGGQDMDLRVLGGPDKWAALDNGWAGPAGLNRLTSRNIIRAGCMSIPVKESTELQQPLGHLLLVTDNNEPWVATVGLAAVVGADRLAEMELFPLTASWRRYYRDLLDTQRFHVDSDCTRHIRALL